MALPIILEVALIVSIAGLIALSLFILYLLDKLQTRVNSLEHISNEMKVLKDEVSALAAEKSQAKTSGMTSGANESIMGIPNGHGSEKSMIERLGANIQTANQRIEELAEKIRTNNSKTDELNHLILETRNALDDLSKRVSGTRERFDILQADISKLATKLEQIEDAMTAIVRKSLQSKP